VRDFREPAWPSARNAGALFSPTPEWVAVVAKTEKDGQVVGNSSELPTPAAFTAVK
jgi:hypothetical protein